MLYREIIAVCSEIRIKQIHCVGRTPNSWVLNLVAHDATTTLYSCPVNPWPTSVIFAQGDIRNEETSFNHFSPEKPWLDAEAVVKSCDLFVLVTYSKIMFSKIWRPA